MDHDQQLQRMDSTSASGPAVARCAECHSVDVMYRLTVPCWRHSLRAATWRRRWAWRRTHPSLAAPSLVRRPDMMPTSKKASWCVMHWSLSLPVTVLHSSLCPPDTYAESFGRDISPSLLNTTDLYGLTASCIRVLRYMEAANLSAGCQPSSEACCKGQTARDTAPHLRSTAPHRRPRQMWFS